MSSIVLNLNNFKASGIYTLEFDQSENIIVTPQTIRLVVGFSKKGPFNTPVFCPDIKTARTVFGDIDTSLERKGSFFHRSLFTCLQTGPCFALNLLALKDDETSPDTSDKVNYRAFSLDTVEDNGVLTPRLLSSFFNKQKFWFNDPEFFLATVSAGDKPKFLDFTNVGKNPMSIIVRKSAVKGYDITAKEWYINIGQQKPTFLDDNDFINDFFVDIVAVEGDWSDYASLAIDPIYSKYFTVRGFTKVDANGNDLITEFISRPEVNLVANITGCLIPDFIDFNGSNQFIETLVNNTTPITGLFCAINKMALDDILTNSSMIDLVGHHLFDPATGLIDPILHNHIDLISYKAPLFNDQLYIDVSPTYVEYQSPFDILHAVEGTAIYADWKNGTITDGDYIIEDSFGTKQYLKFFSGTANNGDKFVDIKAYDAPDFSGQDPIALAGTTYDSHGILVASGWNIVSLYGKYNEFFDTIDPSVYPATTLGSNEFILVASDAGVIKIGDLIISSILDTNFQVNGFGRMTRVTKKTKLAINGDTKISCQQPIKLFSSSTPGSNGKVEKFQRLQDFIKELQFTYLSGFKLTDAHIPNGTDSRQNEIMQVMYDTNIATSLASKDIITFRYIVDTFSGGLEPNCKHQLTNLALLRKKAIALVNLPSFAQFAASTDPVFTDAPTQSNPKPIIDTAYIADGGNQSLNPSFSFTLSDETNGSKYAGYFSPHLVLRDNNKNIVVPPAAHVSNLFVQKFLNGTPFAIVAGPRRGLISDANLVGVEYDLNDADRANLEPLGVNPIIRRRGVGIMIFANQTGYQRVNSALNNLHVRDMLVTIEEDIENILSNYLFEFNDPSTRLEVKSKVDNYLEGVQSAGGVFNFTTVMDTSNNTPIIIDQNVGIIDIIVEPSRGIQKFINRITIAKTGAIASGGFSIA